MTSNQPTRRLAFILIASVLGAIAHADDLARERERLVQERKRAEEAAEQAQQAKRAAEERMRESELRIYREARPEPSNHNKTFSEAVQLEREGKTREAVKAYVSAARAGSGKAARRLGEIYNMGIPGVPQDPNEAIKWNNFARTLGEDVPKPTMWQ